MYIEQVNYQNIRKITTGGHLSRCMGVYSPTQALQRNQITPSLTTSLPLSPINTIY